MVHQISLEWLSGCWHYSIPIFHVGYVFALFVWNAPDRTLGNSLLKGALSLVNPHKHPNASMSKLRSNKEKKVLRDSSFTNLVHSHDLNPIPNIWDKLEPHLWSSFEFSRAWPHCCSCGWVRSKYIPVGCYVLAGFRECFNICPHTVGSIVFSYCYVGSIMLPIHMDLCNFTHLTSMLTMEMCLELRSSTVL